MGYSKVWFIVIIVLGFAGWCIGENFLVERSIRRKTAGQLKQEIVELFAILLQQTSKSIELQAQAQQLLCTRIQEIAENSKSGAIARLQGKELVHYAQQLSLLVNTKEQELKEQQRILTILR